MTLALPLSRLNKIRLAGLLLAAAFASAAPAPPTDMLRLGSNENPYGYTPKAEVAMVEAIKSAQYYNRTEIQALIDVLAVKEGVPRDYLYVTAGSGTVLELIGMAYYAPGGNVVNISPGYPQIGWAFKRMGGEIKFAPLGENMGYDFAALAKTIDANTKIVVICNPNNPTGALADPKALRNFIMGVPENVLVVVDEAYLELADTPLTVNSAAPLTKLRKNLAVTRTFSKAYGMAGVRIGYAIANPEILAKLKRIDPGSSPSFIAAAAAKAAVQDQDFMEGNRRKYSAVRNYTMRELDKLGLKYNVPQGAFILFEIGMDSGEAQSQFRDNGILISRPTLFDLAPGDDVKYKNWVRVSLGTQEDMEKFFQTLRMVTERQFMGAKKS